MKKDEAINELLRPILWDWSSSVRARMNLVIARHKEVKTAYPFMSKKHKKMADEWFEKEAHSGLWD